MLSQHFLHIFFIVSATCLALGSFNNGVQQMPMGDDLEDEDRETIKITFTATRMRTAFDFHTKTMRKEYVATAMAQRTAEAQPTPAVRNSSLAAKMLQAKQRQDSCDETACAGCKWYYQCERGTPECFQCDTKPYCECGEH